MPNWETCPDCRGSGVQTREDDSAGADECEWECQGCDGSGLVEMESDDEEPR